MRKVNDDGMNNEHQQKEKKRSEGDQGNQNQDGGPHNECFSFFLIDVSIARIYLEN